MKPSSSRQRPILIASSLILLVALYFGWQWAGQETARPTPTAKKDTPAAKQEPIKTLNSEAQVNASRHLVNLTGDEDYGLIAGFLVDDKMNPEVTEVLFSDLMNRNRELQMPLFMNILKNKRHPQNEEVRNVLTVLAGEDFGENFAAWDKWAAEELAKEKAEE
jgi:hypothetical protein